MLWKTGDEPNDIFYIWHLKLTFYNHKHCSTRNVMSITQHCLVYLGFEGQIQ